MKLYIMMAIYIATEVLGLAILYGPLRKCVDPEREHPGRVMIPIYIIGLLLLFPITGALVKDGPVCWFFQKWGNTFIGYLIYFFGTLLLVRIVELIVNIIRSIRAGEKQRTSRKASAIMLITILALSVALNIGGFAHAHDVKTTFYEVPKESLGLDQPLRLVLIGDTHIGVNSTPQIYRDMVDRINEQEPDIVLFAGDIVTSSFGAMREPDTYAEILSGMKAKIGKYVVYGNHDVDEPLLGGFTFIGADNARRNPQMEQFLKDSDLTLLRDEVIRFPELNDLCIAGRRDESRPGDGVKVRATLEELLSETSPEDHILLLQHEPSDLTDLDAYGVDMAVSGHTHDGQLFPGNVFTRIKGPQSYGFKQWGNANVIVTSGVGYYGPPIRVGTISEVAVIDLK